MIKGKSNGSFAFGPCFRLAGSPMMEKLIRVQLLEVNSFFEIPFEFYDPYKKPASRKSRTRPPFQRNTAYALFL